VSIHRKDCANVEALGKAYDEGRWISVYWADETNDKYETSIEIAAKDRPDLVIDIMTLLSSLKITVSSLNARRFVDGYDAISIAMEVKDLNQLKTVSTKLNHLQNVVQVTRKSFEG
jgi:GTP pyrophosphokinase